MGDYVPAEDRYDQMDYRYSGRSGLKLPALSLGLWQNFGNDRPEETQRAILRRAFDRGITHFDLANNYGPPYGRAEENFGVYLREDFAGLRDELVISSKAGWDMWPGPYGQGGGSRKYVLASLDQSLDRMGLEYVDIFYSHRFDPETPVEETMQALDTAVRSGRALYAGISSYSPAKTREAATIARELGTPLLIHQPSYSMLNRWIEQGLLDELEEQGMGCIVFSALAQGLLTDRYLDGIPKDSRAARSDSTIGDDHLDEATLGHVRALNEIAASRGQKLAQMALAVGAAGPAGHLGGDRGVLGRAARHQPRRPGGPTSHRRRARRHRPERCRRRHQPVGGFHRGLSPRDLGVPVEGSMRLVGVRNPQQVQVSPADRGNRQPYASCLSTANAAAPTMPAVLRRVAAMISVSMSMSGMNSWPCLLTPPPTTIRSGENSFSSVR